MSIGLRVAFAVLLSGLAVVTPSAPARASGCTTTVHLLLGAAECKVPPHKGLPTGGKKHKSTLVIQPPDGLTLVNFRTNFYTTSTQPIPQTVTLLEQQVTIEATPVQYHWDFGDGGVTSTQQPGAPYPELTITHEYLRKGEYAVTLATTYHGRYRVGGGGWQDIPETLTVAGAPRPLRAIEAQPKLVGY